MFDSCPLALEGVDCKRNYASVHLDEVAVKCRM